MTRSIVAVCTPGVAIGFELAGLPTRSCATPSDVVKEFKELTERDTGIIFMQDVLFEQLPELQQRTALPLIVPFPSPARSGRISSIDYVAELLRRAIGYRVRIR